jgi:hypothetical protein
MITIDSGSKPASSNSSACTTAPKPSDKLTPVLITALITGFASSKSDEVDGTVWAILDRGDREHPGNDWVTPSLVNALAARKAQVDGHYTAAKNWAARLVAKTRVELDKRNTLRANATNVPPVVAKPIEQPAPAPTVEPATVASAPTKPATAPVAKPAPKHKPKHVGSGLGALAAITLGDKAA